MAVDHNQAVNPNSLQEIQKNTFPSLESYNALVRAVKNLSKSGLGTSGPRAVYVGGTPDSAQPVAQLINVDNITSISANIPFGATFAIADEDSKALAVSDDLALQNTVPTYVRLIDSHNPAYVKCAAGAELPVTGEECGVNSAGLASKSGSGLLCIGQPVTGFCWVVKSGGASAVKWGTVDADVTEWALTGCTEATVKQADDCETPNATGDAFTVVLPEIEETTPNLHAGDIISFTEVDTIGGTSYSCVSDYTKSGGGAVVVSLNGDIGQWLFTAGCQTVSGDIVACSGSGGEVGQTVDIIIPNLNSREPFPVSGDRVSAAPSDLTASPPKYVITSDYSKSSSNAVVASLNGDIGQWLFTAGCQTVSADVVVCSGSNGEFVGETVDIIIPNLNSREPFPVSGDNVSAAPTDLTASPKKYVITSDYSKSELPEVRPFTLTASLAGGSAAATFDETGHTTETLTAVDRNGVYDYGESGDSGYVAWIIRASQWEIIDFPCDDGTGS
jgi:hypothetical protein